MTWFKDQEDPSLPAWIIDAETSSVENPPPRVGLQLPATMPVEPTNDEEPSSSTSGGTVIVFDI